jgi:hypothetical protein
MNGAITSDRCGSEPHSPLDLIRTMAPVGSSTPIAVNVRACLFVSAVAHLQPQGRFLRDRHDPTR